MQRRTLVLTIFLYLAQLGLFLWITLRPFTISPPNRTYNILRGQGAYTSFIRQAKDGAWSLYNTYTTRPAPAVYAHLLYVFLGKIAAIFSVDPVYIYMVTRIVAGLLLFLATYWFISVTLPSNLHLLAVLFALGLEPGPLLSAIKNIPSIILAPPAIFSYVPQEVALRHFGLPHHVLAEAFGLLLVGNLVLYVKKSSRSRLIPIGIFAVVGTLLMPAYNSVLVLTVLPAWWVWTMAHKNTKRIILPFALVILVMAALAVFTKSQLDVGYPWKDFNLDEKRWVTDRELLINYISSLLLFLPATMVLLASLPRAWRHLDAWTRLLIVLLTSWIVGPLLYIPLTHLPIFPLANFRLVDGYAYVPMGILSALGLRGLAAAIKKRWVVGVGVSLMIAASLFLTVSYTKQVFADQHKVWSNVYPTSDEWNAIRFLSHTPRRSGVLVMKYLGEIIPSYASVRVFLGETPGQIDFADRYFEAVTFYSGTLSDTDARLMLQRENISYVWWGADEKVFLTTGALYPNILLPVFQTPVITVFQVK